MTRRRIWTEFLAPEDLGAPETLALLRRHDLQPLIAMPPRSSREEAAMIQALRRLQESEVAIGLWPLLGDSEGYWPGVENAARFRERVEELLAMARRESLSLTTVAIDLEPSVQRKREFLAASTLGRARCLRESYRQVGLPRHEQAFAEAVSCYQRLASDLRRAGIESLAIAVPPVLVDMGADAEFWQSLFGTPLTGPGWDTLSPMFYRSMIRDALPSQSSLMSRAIFAEACRRLADARPCMSLGVVGPGKLADEASYACPEELAWDVACATEAGIDDLALFSLESVLERPHPEQWLRAFTQPPRYRPPPLGERVARGSIRSLLGCAVALTRSVR